MSNYYKFKGILATLMIAASSASLSAAVDSLDADGLGDATPLGIVCRKASLVRDMGDMTAKMDLDFSQVKVKSNQAAIFTPMIVNGEDTLRLPGFGIYGRNRWYQLEREERLPLTGQGEISMHAGKQQGLVKYSQTLEYESWMNGATLELERVNYGCANCEGPEFYSPVDLAYYRVETYEPNFVFIAAVAEEVKTREISGRAYVDFPVNQTIIYPDYRRNSVELAKIIGTIDSVKNDKDVTVTALSIKGFASPEGSYENNIRLAKGRTEALMNYVQQLYQFPYGFIHTSYEPEDWEGLREYVQNSLMPNKMAILAIIDSSLAPDPKNTKIQKDFPADYAFLLQNVYPGLRHSDYKIEYEIKQFSDLGEIAEVLRLNPTKLSLNEMYLLASSYMPGTPEYNDVMETAVRLYPNDETAILNAATAALQRGDLVQAERYLNRAGNSGDALYARGLLAAMQKDYGKAIWYLEQAQAKGNPNAAPEIEKLQLVKKYSN